MSDRPPASFAEFWPKYVLAHCRFATQLIHTLSTLAGLAFAAWLLFSGRWMLLPLMLVICYSPAWMSHLFIEKNRPATFQHVFYSLLGDLKMIALFLTGRMAREVERHLQHRRSQE